MIPAALKPCSTNPLFWSEHFQNLRASYKKVGDNTWNELNFLEKNLETSRNLFTPKSLELREPEPKKLEVFALLSGLPFGEDFINFLSSIQANISYILGDSLHYWVERDNFGVEYCVFKWPQDDWQDYLTREVGIILESIKAPRYQFHIIGIQINPDGCVVAKGFDENAALFNIRSQIKEKISFLPDKQSGWAHVPLGRILEPLSEDKFARLSAFISRMSDSYLVSAEIASFKFIHETRWYMTEKVVLQEYLF